MNGSLANLTFNVANFLGPFIAMYTNDRLGRKVNFIAGVGLQAIA